jgi:hypothetical protein
MPIEKSNDLIGNQSHDLWACSIVPQHDPITLLIFKPNQMSAFVTVPITKITFMDRNHSICSSCACDTAVAQVSSHYAHNGHKPR